MTLQAIMRDVATSTEEHPQRLAEKTVPTMAMQAVTVPGWKILRLNFGPLARVGKASGWLFGFITNATAHASAPTASAKPQTKTGNRIAALFEEVDEMKRLHADWNGYGSEPPTVFARDIAQQILLDATTVIVPSRVTASAQGGVGICFNLNGKYADIECLNTGEILATTSDGRAVPQVWEVKPNASKGALERIVLFLNS